MSSLKSTSGVPSPFSTSSLITVATCNLNQWALDFDGNLERVYESCVRATLAQAAYRLGPELELCGYGCEDHFYEDDTIQHCWESLVILLERGVTDYMICDFGMPLIFGSVRYNCRVICYQRRVLLIRPKTALADNGNYRESRYFTAYSKHQVPTSDTPQTYVLPTIFQQKFQQTTVPFGLNAIRTNDGVTFGCESCEELWTPSATHIELALQGVDIITNGSGSYHELRKLDTRVDLIVSATKKCGGLYLYSNQRGCDGGRLYYDGGALIVCNGQVLAQAAQFDLQDVHVVTATVNINDIRSYRASIPSFGIQAVKATPSSSTGRFIDYHHIDLLHRGTPNLAESQEEQQLRTQKLHPTAPLKQLRVYKPEEECCLGPACWLWDYLRRSGASGFLLPLSGGADSSSVATIVGVMCSMATEAAKKDPSGTIAQDCRRICRIDTNKEPLWTPSSYQEMASFTFHTIYMGTKNSSVATTSRAQRLSEAIGSYHLSIRIDDIVDAVLKLFTSITGHTPLFTVRGGSMSEDLALQNIQARLRMVTAYMFAQLLPWVRGRSGFLLVLGSANVDEGLRGYMTKYDCSSADLNPIGAISKKDLKKMLTWATEGYHWAVLKEIADAPPTAELRPQQEDNETAGAAENSDVGSSQKEHSQKDEEEMGMTYKELSMFGILRKIHRCGPVSMYIKLRSLWDDLSAIDIAAKVKRFFYYYSINRHKMCTITPSYHAENYSPDDNRFDLRPFLYNVKWTRQFGVIDQLVQQEQESKSMAENNT